MSNPLDRTRSLAGEWARLWAHGDDEPVVSASGAETVDSDAWESLLADVRWEEAAFDELHDIDPGPEWNASLDHWERWPLLERVGLCRLSLLVRDVRP